MIVRIMGEGQFQLAAAAVATLQDLDQRLDEDLLATEPDAFRAHLQEMVTLVRSQGSPLTGDDAVVSDAVLPPAGMGIEELRLLLQEDGMVPG